MLKEKKILLGVTGSIAAYKSVYLARLLVQSGAQVNTVLTPHAAQFIQPLTFEAITQQVVHQSLFEKGDAIAHIELARLPDLIVIAPASASFIARLAHGFADDLLTATCLATQANILVVPAMNRYMWENPVTQENIARLKNRNIQILDPISGEQACGDIGDGCMPEPESIFKKITQMTQPHPFWAGKRVLMTVGATRAPIDPVRYISNHSSGKMGFALANALLNQGAQVSLICGYCETPPPQGARIIYAKTTQEMEVEISAHMNDVDVFIGAAAVSDYRVKTPSAQKLKSSPSDNDSANSFAKSSERTLVLEKNPDLFDTIKQIHKKPFLVGFALETENLISNATQKLKQKQLDMLVANLCQKDGFPLGSDENEVIVLLKNQEKPLHLPKNQKSKIAEQLVMFMTEVLQQSTHFINYAHE